MKATDATKILVTLAVVLSLAPPIIWGWLIFGGSADSGTSRSSAGSSGSNSGSSSPPPITSSPKPKPKPPDRSELSRIWDQWPKMVNKLEESEILNGYSDSAFAGEAFANAERARTWLATNEGRSAGLVRVGRALAKAYDRLESLAYSPSQELLDEVNRSIGQLNRMGRRWWLGI
jgi:hypothetical protein